MFSKIFIERPIFASVISIVIVLVGSIALVALPIARYPDIAPPTIEVTANYPGANAKTVADTVATPIEQEVNGFENMAYMSSTSTADGAMTLIGVFGFVGWVEVDVDHVVQHADRGFDRRLEFLVIQFAVSDVVQHVD